MMNSSGGWLKGRWLLRLLLATAATAMLIGIVASGYYQLNRADEWDKIRIEEAHHIQLQKEALSNDLRHIAYTLAFLRDQVEAHLSSTSKETINFFKLDLLSFINTSDLYDQIRLIDPSGMEVARVNYNNGYPSIVPEERLQFKGDRFYFKQSIGLDKGEIYISPMDLNIEHGQVERPFKPAMRFAMPLFDGAGVRLGILVLNFRAQSMLDDYRRSFIRTQASSQLLNANGYWLYHPDSRYEWGEMLPERAGQSMAKLAPERWRRISGKQTGQFVDQGELINFTSVYPLQNMIRVRGLKIHAGGEYPLWKLISSFPVADLDARMQPLAVRTALLAILAFMVIAILLVMIIRARALEEFFAQEINIRTRAMDESPVGIVLCDARQDDLPMIYCNDAFVHLSGYPREEVLHRNCRFMQGGDSEQPAVARMREAIAAVEPCMVLLRNYRADGSMFWAEVSIAPVHDGNGQLTHFVGYHQDVSERELAAEKQSQLLMEVRLLSQSLMTAHDVDRQAMARSLHDDIGQLTTVLMQHAELAGIACRNGDAEKTCEAIDEIAVTVKMLMQSVRTSLHALREGAPGGLMLGEQLEQLCAGWRRPGLAIELVIDVSLDDIEPAAARHIYHIVQEALNNVVRHAGASHVCVSLRSAMMKEQGVALELRVEDNGCGFDTVDKRGFMGLVIMRERIEAMGGSWLLESQLHRGTTIGGTIPLLGGAPAGHGSA